MELGVYLELSNEDYHADREFISASQVNAMADSIEHWLWKRDQKRTPSKSMLIGSVVHLALESRLKDNPKLLSEGIVILPEKIGYMSQKLPAFCEENKGRYPIAEQDLPIAFAMANKVLEHPDTKGYFKGGISEPSIFVKHEATGVNVKCRPDILRTEDGLSINFKTTSDASKKGFIRSTADYRYDIQSCFYIDILSQQYGRSYDEIHLLCETPKDPAEPIRLGVYSYADESLAFARVQYTWILEKYKRFMDSGVAEGFDTKLDVITLPSWVQSYGSY